MMVRGERKTMKKSEKERKRISEKRGKERGHCSEKKKEKVESGRNRDERRKRGNTTASWPEKTCLCAPRASTRGN